MSKRQGAKREKPIKYFDYSLLFIIIFLVCFGLVMLYSTSSYNGEVKFGDAAFYLKKQLFATVLGLIAMGMIANIDYHVWMRFGKAAYLLALALCVSVIFVGTTVNGSKRWLRLGPLSWRP